MERNLPIRLIYLIYGSQITDTLIRDYGGTFSETLRQRLNDNEDLFVSFHDTSNEITELLDKANRMVKDKNCPNPIRNRFYHHKHRYLMQLLKEGGVDEIIESDGFYKFVIGTHSFHQPKLYFKGTAAERIQKVDGHEEYTKTDSYLPYDESVVRQCITDILLYIPNSTPEWHPIYRKLSIGLLTHGAEKMSISAIKNFKNLASYLTHFGTIDDCLAIYNEGDKLIETENHCAIMMCWKECDIAITQYYDCLDCNSKVCCSADFGDEFLFGKVIKIKDIASIKSDITNALRKLKD